MVTIYGTPGCVWCERAKVLAESSGIKYQYIDVASSEETKNEFKERFPGVMTVPQIVWYDRHIGGYTEFAREVEETRNYGDGQI